MAEPSTVADNDDGGAVVAPGQDNGEAKVGGAGDNGEHVDDGEGNAANTAAKEKNTPEIKAAPQAQEPAGPGLRNASGLESEGEMVDCKLSPLEIQNQRQNLKDVLMSENVSPPPLPENNSNDDHHNHHNDHHQSALHQDEYSQYNNHLQPHNPHNHESALFNETGSPSSNTTSPSSINSDNNNNNSNKLNPFKARTKNRLKPGQGGSKKGHSHPRKSPYKSEVARLRHAQQLEKEKREFAKDPPDDLEGLGFTKNNSNSSPKSISIKDTTAPPDTAFFSIQSSKLKHSLLHSLGEFLTSAFADDEEASGSYFSQDLLDQLSSSNPRLRGVWLQAKSLNDKHIQQLCEALIRNKVVTEVWLPSNQITDVGAGHIAHMLKFNHSIKELFLGSNDIGPKGAAALASALARGNITLVALGLGDNRIGVEGAGAFAAALRHNHTLHTLDIKNNGIPKKSSIRGLLSKMLDFNASDPGDESLVLGLQEELANLVSTLPPDMAESVVLQAEESLKMAMLCRKRGDKIGAAEAEGVFIRICTTGEPPVDPPEESGGGSGGVTVAKQSGSSSSIDAVVKKKKRPKKPMEPDRLDGLNEELSTLKFNEGPPAKEEAAGSKGDGAVEPVTEGDNNNEAEAEQLKQGETGEKNEKNEEDNEKGGEATLGDTTTELATDDVAEASTEEK
ncbi:hypothetical protein ACHAXR_004288 [Thalassiosira sp. AJA248-18]